jgi:hypothetical protein
MAPDKWIGVSYEQFVRDPAGQLATLCSFIGLSMSDRILESAVSRVSVRNLGKGRRELDLDDASRVESLVAPAVSALQSLTGSRQA